MPREKSNAQTHKNLYINIYNIVYVITRLLNSVELYFGNVPVSTNNLQTSDVCVHCFYFN